AFLSRAWACRRRQPKRFSSSPRRCPHTPPAVTSTFLEASAIMHSNPSTITVGAAIAAFLEECGVKAAFGVISIHNMPILDAMHERGKIRWVMARGEARGTSMADAYGRTTGGLGLCLSSTGTAAGSSAGAVV